MAYFAIVSYGISNDAADYVQRSLRELRAALGQQEETFLKVTPMDVVNACTISGTNLVGVNFLNSLMAYYPNSAERRSYIFGTSDLVRDKLVEFINTFEAAHGFSDGRRITQIDIYPGGHGLVTNSLRAGEILFSLLHYLRIGFVQSR